MTHNRLRRVVIDDDDSDTFTSSVHEWTAADVEVDDTGFYEEAEFYDRLDDEAYARIDERRAQGLPDHTTEDEGVHAQLAAVGIDPFRPARRGEPRGMTDAQRLERAEQARRSQEAHDKLVAEWTPPTIRTSVRMPSNDDIAAIVDNPAVVRAAVVRAVEAVGLDFATAVPEAFRRGRPSKERQALRGAIRDALLPMYGHDVRRDLMADALDCSRQALWTLMEPQNTKPSRHFY